MVRRQLVGIDEIAAMLKVSPSGAARSIRSPGFPDRWPDSQCGPRAGWSRGGSANRPTAVATAPPEPDYHVRLEALRRWDDGDERYVVRLEVLAGQTTVPVERYLAAAVGDRIVGEPRGTDRWAAERAVYRALAQEAAAAVGRQIERVSDLWAIPAVEWLRVGSR